MGRVLLKEGRSPWGRTGSRPVSGAVSRWPSLGPCLSTCEASEIWFTWGPWATVPAPWPAATLGVLLLAEGSPPHRLPALVPLQFCYQDGVDGKLTMQRRKGQQGAHNPTKGVRASVRPPGSCRQVGKWFSWAFFRGPWAQARMGASPSWKAVSAVVELPPLRGGEGLGARAACSEPLGELASPPSPLHSSVMTLHSLFLWWLGWQSSRP